MKIVLNREIIVTDCRVFSNYKGYQVFYHFFLLLSTLPISFCLEFPFLSNGQTLIAVLIVPLCTYAGN